MPESRDVILDSINEGVFTVGLDWRVTSFNRAAERITGVPRKKALGQLCSEVFHASVCQSGCPLRKTLETGKPSASSSARIIANSGRSIPIRISAAAIRDENGKITGGVETFQDLTQVEELRMELQNSRRFENIIGGSPAMTRLFGVLPQIAESSASVLIEGPSGTGKELFARAIHNLSPRKKKKFVAVNCAALPDSLLESELFGHRAGAFTDARRDKPGRFQIADGGTIFLDEIGDMSPAMQTRLLRVLQERVVEPLGSTEPVRVSVRLVAATNKKLRELVKEGKFREDLYYRVRVVYLELPPLSRRREDIPLLAESMISKFNSLHGKDIAGISPDAVERLMRHDYPGNVRELENIIEQSFVLCRGGLIEARHLPPELQEPEPGRGPAVSSGPVSLRAMERRLIEEALARRNGGRGAAARDLGVNPSTLYRKILALKIKAPETDGRGVKI
jgi:PAS domain S-box-containing protein